MHAFCVYVLYFALGYEMTLRNRTEYTAFLETTINDNTSGDVTPEDIRLSFEALADAVMPTTGNMSGDIETFAVTTSPQKLTTFSDNDSSNNEIFEPDEANDRINVIDNCVVLYTILGNAEWPNNQDLIISVRVNGNVAATGNPVELGGGGTNKPRQIFGTGILLISQTLVDAGTGGANIEVFVEGESNYDLDQLNITMALQYIDFTINTLPF